jgi:hypothetical protein
VSEDHPTWLQLRAAAEPARRVTRTAAEKDFMVNVYATRRLSLGEADTEV